MTLIQRLLLVAEIRDIEGNGYAIQYLKDHKKEINFIDYNFLMKAARRGADECEHLDVEDFHCLDCGADRNEHIMSAIHDRGKDLRKYGGL